MGRFRKLEVAPLPDDEPRAGARGGAPRDEGHWLERARESERGYRFDEAHRFYARALEHERRLPEAWAGVVRMLSELKEHDQARRFVTRAQELLGEDDRDLLAAQALAAARAGHPDLALRLSDRSLQGAADRAEAASRWLARGEALLAAGQAQFDHAFREADRLGQSDWYLRVCAARALRRFDRAAEALAWGQRACERGAAAAVAWLEVGLAQALLGQDERAQASLRQALKLDPDLDAAVAALRRLEARHPLAALWTRIRGLLGG